MTKANKNVKKTAVKHAAKKEVFAPKDCLTLYDEHVFAKKADVDVKVVFTMRQLGFIAPFTKTTRNNFYTDKNLASFKKIIADLKKDSASYFKNMDKPVAKK